MTLRELLEQFREFFTLLKPLTTMIVLNPGKVLRILEKNMTKSVGTMYIRFYKIVRQVS